MATYKIRGTSHNVIYNYNSLEGVKKQQWETYTTELEAVQRKAYIDYLQRNKKQDELLQAAIDYRKKAEKEKSIKNSDYETAGADSTALVDNTQKTYKEFVEKWLPFHARKERLSPTTYDSYKSNLKVHILPYFGERIMNTITTEDIDNFIDHLSRTPCKGSKSYNKNPTEIPTLSSGSIKKCYSILTAGFPTAKKWQYISEIPQTKAPAEKTKKRKAWEPKEVYAANEGITDDKLLHLAVHIAFVCSLRAGETAGIDARKIDFHDRSFWITQEVQRVSNDALDVIPKNEIIRIFPKVRSASKSSLILKAPKTEGSVRKQYLTTPLLMEIKERMTQIQQNQEFFGEEYQDYGLLICQPDGRPIDPKSLNKAFKKWQFQQNIKNQIEFQGLRKSGQMHKVRLSQNNYQLVAENSGQSPEVLMSNYNEALESEKRVLSQMVENSFYQKNNQTEAESFAKTNVSLPELLKTLLQSPEILAQLVQAAHLQTPPAQHNDI